MRPASVPLSSFLPPLLRTLAYGAGLLLIADVALHRVAVDDGWALAGENGRVELIQVAVLLVGLALALMSALRRPACVPLPHLFAGSITILLVREQNNWFKDEWFSGSWQILAAVVGLFMAWMAWHHRWNLFGALAMFVRRPAFAWLASGAILTLFAQLLDERSLWVLLQGDEHAYATRRFAEEALELAGYWLVGAGLLELYLTTPPATKTNGDTTTS